MVNKTPETNIDKQLYSNSIVLINKPCGHTSHEITTFVKKLLDVKRTGHAGTLDPEVSGVLPIAIGRATKLIQYIAGKDKIYVGIIKFKEIKKKDEIEKLFSEFTGVITQTPPKISAVKKVPRKRTIHYLKLLEINKKNPRLALFETKVDAGTYIRTLCEDIGKKCGSARMEELRRIAVGNITENQCHTMQDLIDAVWLLKEKNDDSEIKKMCVAPEKLIELPKVIIKETSISSIKQGAQIMAPAIVDMDKSAERGDPIAIYSENGDFVGIGTDVLNAYDLMKKKTGLAVKLERVHI